MKKFYEMPSVELTALRSEDVITLSLLEGYAFDEASGDHVYDVSSLVSPQP